MEKLDRTDLQELLPQCQRQVYYRLMVVGLIANIRSDYRVKQHRVIKKQSQLSLV